MNFKAPSKKDNLGPCNLVIDESWVKAIQDKVTCLVTANDKQGWICRVESTWSQLSPTAVKLIHTALIVQWPHLHYVFTDRHDIFSSGIPAQGTNFLSVALQFPRNGTIRAALNDLLPITGELYWSIYKGMLTMFNKIFLDKRSFIPIWNKVPAFALSTVGLANIFKLTANC